MFTIGSYFLSKIHVAEQREVKQREKEGSWSGPLSRSAHSYLAGEGGYGYVNVAVSWQNVQARKLK
jgi:hypothetical protein